METRRLGADGPRVTACGLGCWQLGGGWGNPWDDGVAQEILAAAYAAGVRFFDTADVYGDGESELSIARFLTSHPDVVVATKLGRTNELYPSGYTEEAMRTATERSLARLGVERLDLTQLHCVPPAVLRDGRVFDWLRRQQQDGLIGRFGASVESVEEGLVCLEQEGVASLQVIFNIFRQKPARELFPKAQDKGVAIIVRLPLASGLLAGTLKADAVFKEGDHRSFNRDGQEFNVGETFAGLPFETGVDLSRRIGEMVPSSMSMAQMALRWILDHEAVTAVIPGASSPAQARANASACALDPLPADLHARVAAFYDLHVRQHIRGPY